MLMREGYDHGHHIDPAGDVPAAVGQQLCATTPEQTGLRCSSRTALDHHLTSSGCWNQPADRVLSEVWGLNWKMVRGVRERKDRG